MPACGRRVLGLRTAGYFEIIDVKMFVGCEGRNEGLRDVAGDIMPCTLNYVTASQLNGCA